MKLPPTLPPGTHELVQELAALNPPRCKRPDESLEEHARYAGVVELIEAMQAKLKAAEERARRS